MIPEQPPCPLVTFRLKSRVSQARLALYAHWVGDADYLQALWAIRAIEVGGYMPEMFEWLGGAIERFGGDPHKLKDEVEIWAVQLLKSHGIVNLPSWATNCN